MNEYAGRVAGMNSAYLIAIVTVISGIPLAVIELLTRFGKVGGDYSRKLTHVFSSLVVVGVSLFVDYKVYVPVGLIFFVILLITRRLGFWNSLYKIQRRSYGEVAFSLGVFGAAFIATSQTEFITAVLIMGIADTAAYLIGSRFGDKVLIYSKTHLGTATFFAVSLFLLWAVNGLSSVLAMIVVATIATALEAVSQDGLDNLTVPLGVVIALVFIV